MISYPNRVGYINNKKGTATTSIGGKTMVYALATKDDSHGKQIYIQTWNGTSGTLSRGVSITPQLPCRVALADIYFLGTKVNLTDPFISFYNPGLASYPTIGNLQPFIEVNIRRDTLIGFENQQYIYYNTPTSTPTTPVLTIIKPTSISIYDVQGSLEIDSTYSNASTDILYININRRIDIVADVTNKGITESKSFSYTVPLVFKLLVNKTSIDATPLPSSWIYPIKGETFGNKIINSNYGGTFSNSSWNYCLIPSYCSDYVHPISFGCLVDICYDSTEKNLKIYSSFGNAVSNQTLTYNQQHTFIVVDLYSSSGYVYGTTYSLTGVGDSHEIASKIQVRKLDTLWILICHSYIQGSTYETTHLMVYDSTNYSQLLFHNKLVGPYGVDIEVKGSYLYLLFSKDSQKYLFSFSKTNLTLNKTLLNSTWSEQAIEANFITICYKNLSDSVKTISQNIIALPGTSSVTSPYKMDAFMTEDGSTVKYILNGEDLSICREIGSFYTLELKDFIIFSNPNVINNIMIYRKVVSSYKNINTTTIVNFISDPILNILKTFDNVGYGASEFSVIELVSTLDDISKICKYSSSDFTLGDTFTVGYWVDPSLGYNAIPTSASYHGIDMIVNISGNLGIKSATDITSWDATAGSTGGIKVDSSTRPDLTFTYNGNYTEWSSNHHIGYNAVCNGSSTVTCVSANGANLLYNATEYIQPVLWNYNLSNSFDLYLPLKMDFTSVGNWNDPSFALSGCLLTFTLCDDFGIPITQSGYLFNINPPKVSGIISTQGITKTVDSIDFQMKRDAVYGDERYTEINNVTKNVQDIWTDILTSDQPFSYIKGNVVSEDIYTWTPSSLQRGDFCYYTYEPKLYGQKPASTKITETSEIVTYCKGHKYRIDNVKIYLDNGSDIIDQIVSQNPYEYTNTLESTATITVTLDINHEDWSGYPLRDSLADTKIYPRVSGLYLYACQDLTWASQFAANKISFKSKDLLNAYPNIEADTTIKYSWIQKPPNLNITGILFTPTYTNLQGTSIAVTVTKVKEILNNSSKVQLFLDIEDEFGQFSSFCLTNKQTIADKSTYNYPV